MVLRRDFQIKFYEVLLIDSKTIRLFSNILKGVGRTPQKSRYEKDLFHLATLVRIDLISLWDVYELIWEQKDL